MTVIIFKHADYAGPGLLGEILRDYGHRLAVLDLHQGDSIPVDLDNVEAVVSCGQPQRPPENEPDWVRDELSYLRQAHEASIPTIGIGFGSQLLARALGGEISRGETSLETGWRPVKLAAAGRDDPVFCGIGWETMQFHWRREQVTKLPDNARHLARSPDCNNQAWALGLTTYGFQYHLEIHEKTIEVWASNDPQSLDQSHTTLDDLRSQTALHYPAFERISRRLFESIALFITPIDRRYKGLVKELHH